MPLYEYACTGCGERTEVLQRIGDAPMRACPRCGGLVTKLFSAPALQFKGSGFYLTDYGRAGQRRTDAAPSSEPAQKAASTESASKDTKADAPATKASA